MSEEKRIKKAIDEITNALSKLKGGNEQINVLRSFYITCIKEISQREGASFEETFDKYSKSLKECYLAFKNLN